MAMDGEYISFKVTVSCVVSLEEFYVQKEADRDTLVQIQNLLNKKGKTVTDVGPGALQEEDFVAAQFPVDKLFYRGKVVSKLMELQSDLTEVEMVEIFFIDFGNTGTVPATSVGTLSPTLQALPAFATRCSMYDCMAVGKDTTLEFSRLVTGHILLMEVMGVHKEVLKVDLVREMGDNIGHTSVRDVLVLSGKALFYSPPDLMIPSTEERKYKKVATMVQGSTYTVLLSHTHKLRDDCVPQFSVQQVSDQDKTALQLPILMEQMKAVYGVKRSEELWGLGRCWPGMVCAVRDSRDKLWYRGEVVSIIKGRLILVKYVDFGNCEQVPAHRMRRLFSDFLELPALATRVCLSVKVEAEDTMTMLREEIGLADILMKILEEGSEKVLPTVDLEVEGVSVSEWLRQVHTLS